MTSDFVEVEAKTQQPLEGVDFTKSGDLVLRQLGIELVTPQLTNVSPWQFAHYIAIENWLTAYKPKSDATNLEKVRGYLEAFHHLCEVEAWEQASKILFLHPNLPTTQALHKQLGTWGYYREEIELYSRLLNKSNQDLDCILLHGLGWAYCYLGKGEKAIEYHQQLLDIACKIHNRKVEAQAQRGLGRAYSWYLGQFQTALQYHHEQLAIAREIRDQEEEGYALDELAYIYTLLGHYQKSLEYAQQALTIAREISNQPMEIKISSTIGNTYLVMGQPRKAIEPFSQLLDLSRKISDRHQEWTALNNLGKIYCCLTQPQAGIEFCEQALDIIRQIGDQVGESKTLECLGAIYSRLRQYNTAIQYFKPVLMIHRQVGNREAEGLTLLNLSYCYGCLKYHRKVIRYCHQVMKIALEINDQRFRGLALTILANSYWYQGKYITGLFLVVKSMLINPPWKSEMGQLIFKKAIETFSITLKRGFNLVFNWF